MKYAIAGYTGPNPDFTDVIELPDNFDFNWSSLRWGNPAYRTLKQALLDSNCDTDYLNVMDECAYELQEDLADAPGQVVLLAESMGCDNCQDPEGNGTGNGDNEYTDGCDDEAPHGGYMITFTPVKERIMSSYNRMIDDLTDFLDYEHVHGCTDATCDIRAAFAEGYGLWAIELFSSSGAASDVFEATYERLMAQYGNRFRRAAERERDEFVKATPHRQCAGCNAVTWATNDCDPEFLWGPGCTCSNCGVDFNYSEGL